MADTDYKIVGNKMYIYPNTDTEQALMNGQIAPTEGYTTYITVQNYYKTVEAQTGYENRLAQYDYYLQCVRVPEWASDAPTPPQKEYKAIIINDPYGIGDILQYTNGTEVNPSAVEVGKQVIFSTNDQAYTQTFPEGLEVEEYGVLPSGAVAYKFRMPNYDVTITISEVQPSYYNINVVDEYSTTYEIKTIPWETITGENVLAGTQIYFVLRSFDHKPSFDPELEVVKKFLPNGTGYDYEFIMPQSDVTITITELQNYSINLVNEDSINVELYNQKFESLDLNNIQEGTDITLLVHDYNYKAVSSDVDLSTLVWEPDYNQWNYLLTMPSNNITITITNRNDAGIHYNGNTDITIQVGETPEYPTLENPNNVSPIIYSSSNTDLATVDSNGNVTLVPDVTGEVYIRARFEGDSTYDLSEATFKINVRDGFQIAFIKTGAVEAKNVRIYNLTKGIDATVYDQTAPNNTIFVIGAAQDDKVMYKDSSNTWTTLTSSYTTETIDEQSENGIEFTIPSGISDYDYILIMTNTDNLYDVTVTGAVNNNLLYNETGLNNWWYNIEDQEHPGTYSTKYPNGTNLGIESRDGQTYTINPEQTLLEGGAVGKYIVMPSVAIEITKTN